MELRQENAERHKTIERKTAVSFLFISFTPQKICIILI